MTDDTNIVDVLTSDDELDSEKYKISLPVKKRGGKRSTSWKKGESGNKAKVGRRSKLDRKMKEIQDLANGDPMKILEAMLVNFADLDFSPSQVIALCDKVMPYKAPKLATIDRDKDVDKSVAVQFNVASSEE